MGKVYLFAGNCITGKILHAEIPDDNDLICSAIEAFHMNLGSPYTWEIYNTSQSIGSREIQFNNRLARAYSEHILEVA